MKNLLSCGVLLAALFNSINLFAQEGLKPPKKNFLAIDIAPLVGVELDGDYYSNTFAATYKHQLNDKYRLSVFFKKRSWETRYNRVMHVFQDTILNFEQLRNNKVSWMSAMGIERTKRYGICEVYYGLQMQFGIEEREFNSVLVGTYGPDLQEQLPYLSTSNIIPYYKDFADYESTIQTHSQSKFVSLGLGIPLGFGVDIFKHVGLQVEIVPGIQLTKSRQEFEYFNQPLKKEVEHTTINMDYVGFNVFLGWKF